MNKQLRMDPEVKARWVKALKSGDYQQAEGALVKDARHCCLGVLCDMFAKDHGLKTWNSATLGREGDDLPGDEMYGLAGFPNEEGMFFARHYDPYVVIDGETRPLSSHNDKNVPFAR